MIGEKSRVFVAGHRGFVGAAVVRILRAEGYSDLCFCSRARLDLRDRERVIEYFEETRPQAVVMCAAAWESDSSDGGFHDLAGDMGMVCNLIDAAHQVEVERFIFIACSTLYPNRARQPCTEASLVSDTDASLRGDEDLGRLIGLRQCEVLWHQCGSFVSIVSGDLYGPGNLFSKGSGQILSSLISRILLAKENGDLSVKCVRGAPVLNELLYVDDLAAACLPLLKDKAEWPILNVGSGLCPSVEELADRIAAEVGYSGAIEWEGELALRGRSRRLRCDRIHQLGWIPRTSLEEGLRREVYDIRSRLHLSQVLEGGGRAGFDCAQMGQTLTRSGLSDHEADGTGAESS